MSSSNLQKIIGKYVIPRSKYWNTKPFPFFKVIGQGQINEEPKTMDVSYEDLPIWYVSDIFPERGLLEIQTTSYMPKYKYGDYIAVNPEDITEFLVHLHKDSPNNGALGNYSEGRVGLVVGDRGDWGNADNEFFYVKDKLTGNESVYSKYDFDVVDSLKEKAAQVSSLMRVSKKGFLPSYVPENIEKLVFSQLTGLPEKTSLQNALKNLKYRIQGPKHIYNVALKQAPLPYGPSEENFTGGKRRKSRGKIGTQMARRGTRKSRGIFSRLYSPIGHLLSAGKESVGAVTNTAKGVVGEGIGGLDKIGRSVTKHANMAVKDVFSRKGGKRRGTRKLRKSRRNTRR